MFTLYIANKNLSSWSLRPWILLKTLNIPFTERLEAFVDGASSIDKFKAFSPTGLVPCLVDDQCTIWDSLAITEYIAESYPQVWPEDKQARAWARSASAEMHSGFNHLRSTCDMNCKETRPKPEMTPSLANELARLDALWQQGLNQFGGPFLAGNAFTAVDAFFAPVVFRAQTYQLTDFSSTSQAWMQHMLALPSMQDWLEAAKLEADIAH